MGGLDELGVLLERLGHGANPTNTTATTAITTTAARDPWCCGSEGRRRWALWPGPGMQDK